MKLALATAVSLLTLVAPTWANEIEEPTVRPQRNNQFGFLRTTTVHDLSTTTTTVFATVTVNGQEVIAAPTTTTQARATTTPIQVQDNRNTRTRTRTRGRHQRPVTRTKEVTETQTVVVTRDQVVTKTVTENHVVTRTRGNGATVTATQTIEHTVLTTATEDFTTTIEEPVTTTVTELVEETDTVDVTNTDVATETVVETSTVLVTTVVDGVTTVITSTEEATATEGASSTEEVVGTVVDNNPSETDTSATATATDGNDNNNSNNNGNNGNNNGNNGNNNGNGDNNGNNNGNNNGDGNGNGNDDPQTSLTLDPRVIQPGLALTGQETPTPGQVESLTTTNNFINFCLTQNVPLTDGQQIRSGSCNVVPMGFIIAKDRIPSAKFVNPKNFDTIPANQAFTVKLKIKNLQAGAFTNAQKTYYGAPATVNDQGIAIGHSHVVIEKLPSLDTTEPLDPTTFAFFKGLNAPLDGDSSLTTTLDKGLEPGFYRMFSINTSSNHQPVLSSVAQHGSMDDGVYFTVQ